MSSRTARSALRRAARPALEYAWRLGIRALALTGGAKVARWASSGGQKILIVAPHPDDEAIGCAGTALLHAQAGDRVCVAIATDGRRSRALSDPAAMARQRRCEAEAAAHVMRVDRLAWLGLPEGACTAGELQRLLSALLHELEPDVIYAPSRIDFHPVHFLVAHALALALDGSRREPPVRIYQVQVPLNRVVTNLVVDVTAVAATSQAALGAYVSQSASLDCAYRQRRYSACWHGIDGQAEVFCELPAQRYIALHRDPPAGWPNAFRGMRPDPGTDPLAYLAGMSERRRIRAALRAPG